MFFGLDCHVLKWQSSARKVSTINNLGHSEVVGSLYLINGALLCGKGFLSVCPAHLIIIPTDLSCVSCCVVCGVKVTELTALK